MKRAAAFLIVLGVALTALYFSERHQDKSHVSPNAVLEMAADVQRDITRAPMRFSRLSEAEEIKIGNELAEQYATFDEKLSPEQQGLQAYIARVGTAVSSHAHRHLPYRFHLIPNRSLINAFSLPGGHVFVGEGLLDLMNSEDQLAFILGHELEHIDHYHCVERIQIEARFRKLNLGIVGELVQIPLEVWEAGYSKDEELEADREGLRLAVISGYSPEGAVSLFMRFHEIQMDRAVNAKSPQQELSELAIQSLEGYFRSHPPTSERIGQVEQIIADEHWQDRRTQKPFSLEYEVHNGELVKQK
jgi:beta-barrel assembly-enhancing protease